MTKDSEKKQLEEQMKRFLEIHGLKSIDEAMNIPVSNLLKMDGFGYRLLHAYFTTPKS